MRAEFAWPPFNGQPPQALPSSVRGRGRGHLLPQGEKAPVSSKGFSFGGSCRPQAADEGGVRVVSLLPGNLCRLSPHPSAVGAADTFSPRGRRLHHFLLTCPRRMSQKLPLSLRRWRFLLSNQTAPAGRPSNTPRRRPAQSRSAAPQLLPPAHLSRGSRRPIGGHCITAQPPGPAALCLTNPQPRPSGPAGRRHPAHTSGRSS